MLAQRIKKLDRKLRSAPKKWAFADCQIMHMKLQLCSLMEHLKKAGEILPEGMVTWLTLMGKFMDYIYHLWIYSGCSFALPAYVFKEVPV